MDEPSDAADRFYALVDSAIASIPPPFAERLGTVAITVEDEATPDQLASVNAYGLFGLYQGVPRTVYGASEAAVPSRITIFRGPLERHFRDPDELAHAVQDTVIHEIAHHFGISDDRIRELQGHPR